MLKLKVSWAKNLLKVIAVQRNGKIYIPTYLVIKELCDSFHKGENIPTGSGTHVVFASLCKSCYTTPASWEMTEGVVVLLGRVVWGALQLWSLYFQVKSVATIHLLLEYKEKHHSLWVECIQVMLDSYKELVLRSFECFI